MTLISLSGVSTAEDVMTVFVDGTKKGWGKRFRAMFDVADQHVDDQIGELLGRLMAVSMSAEGKRMSKDHEE